MKDATQQNADRPARPTCILYAEDNPLTSAAVYQQLRNKGFEIDTAKNGQEAMLKFLSNPMDYDLIITDQTMPILSGDEWLKRIRRRGFTPKVIVYSAELTEGVLSTMRELQVQKDVQKAEPLEALFEAIEQILQTR